MFNPTSALFVSFALVASVYAAPRVTATSGDLRVRATTDGTCIFPEATRSESFQEPQKVATGEVFDGNNARFDRGAGACQGQKEGGDSDAVFILEDGASLSNVIIGADQLEGVHCMGSCTLTNVWFEDVCEDAVTVKQECGVTTITGGGAKGAEDKVVQHNGGGTVVIDDFCVEDFGKLYRSCGNCKSQSQRSVEISNLSAKSGKLLCGINTNFGDTCTVDNVQMTSVDATCTEFEGNDTGDEPKKLKTDENNSFCQF